VETCILEDCGGEVRVTGVRSVLPDGRWQRVALWSGTCVICGTEYQRTDGDLWVQRERVDWT